MFETWATQSQLSSSEQLVLSPSEERHEESYETRRLHSKPPGEATPHRNVFNFLVLADNDSAVSAERPMSRPAGRPGDLDSDVRSPGAGGSVCF